MQLGSIGKILIGLGCAILLYAFSMSVAMPGSDVVNIHMISERQNALLFGGLLFISGIILFGVAKLKQTTQENELEKSRNDENARKAKYLIGNSAGLAIRGTESIAAKASQLWIKYFVRLSQGWVSLLTRLVVGYLCAWESSNILRYILGFAFVVDWDNADIAAYLMLILMFLYAFRNAPLEKVFQHIFLIFFALLGGLVAFFLSQGEFSPSTRILTDIGAATIAIGITVYMERRQKKI